MDEIRAEEAVISKSNLTKCTRVPSGGAEPCLGQQGGFAKEGAQGPSVHGSGWDGWGVCRATSLSPVAPKGGGGGSTSLLPRGMEQRVEGETPTDVCQQFLGEFKAVFT